MTIKKKQILGLVLATMFVLSCFTPQAQSYFSLQGEQRLAVGDNLDFVLKLPPFLLNVINVSIQEGEKLFSLNGDMSIACLLYTSRCV